jgi:hypothetical protein
MRPADDGSFLKKMEAVGWCANYSFPAKNTGKKTKPWTDGGRRVKYIPMDADDVTYRLRLHMLLPLQCNGTVVPTK